MLKFGKKVNFRPLIVSLVFALFLGLISQQAVNTSIGFIVGASVFLLIFLGYYWRMLPTLFTYWETDNNSLNYNQMDNMSDRLLMMLAPLSNQLGKIDFDSIESATITGNLEKTNDMPFALPYSVYLSLLSGILSITRNPINVTFNLKDGSSITLSVARDFIYNREETIDKLDKLFGELDSANVKIIDKTNHNVKLSY